MFATHEIKCKAVHQAARGKLVGDINCHLFQLHTTEVNDGYDWGRLNLQSVTAESSLQEFLSTAELANREFVAEKLNIKYVMFNRNSTPQEVDLITSQPNFDEPLTVPRR